MNRILSSGLSAFALAITCLTASAATYNVGPGRLYAQLTSVAGLLEPGDLVLLDAGATFSATNLTRSGTAAQPITIRGTVGGASRPVIDAQNTANDGLRMDVDHYVVEDVVVRGALQRCIYLHGHNLTLRRVQVNTCAQHGILGADTETGDMLLTEVEVFGTGNSTTPSQFHHPIYIATDHVAYPAAVLRIEKSWIHDNFSGNSIKSRARNFKAFYNWIEATNGQNHTIEAIGPDGQTCPVPNGSNDAVLCNGEIVGNVLIARGNKDFMMRLGGDGTGNSYGRYHVVNNTFIANATFNSTSSAMIRAFGNIDSIELHNNIFWLQQGDVTGIRIVRDAPSANPPETIWASGSRKVTGRRNVITGSSSTYASGIPAAGIAGLTETIFTTTTAPTFVNVNLATPEALDLRLQAASPARMAGSAGSTTSAGYGIPNPTNLPTMQPPTMRPSPGQFTSTNRPAPTTDAGVAVTNAISAGAFELAFASKRHSDFNGDNRSDMLWYNVATGQLFEQQMDGFGSGANALIYQEANLDWKVVSTADLNGDGKADVIWYNITSGTVYGFLMNGTTIASAGSIYTESNTNWKVVGAGDFDGDGKADILWRNVATGHVYVLFVNGLTATGGGIAYYESDLNWQIQKVGDFNGDGKSDILWRNTANGGVYLLLMNGATPTGGAVIATEPNPDWKVIAVADFGGDGKADILWRNSATGQVYMMQMNGTVISSGALVYTEPDTSWKIVATGDYNGDGKADFLWRNSSNGYVYMMLMNGFTSTAGAIVYYEPNQNWTILGP